MRLSVIIATMNRCDVVCDCLGRYSDQTFQDMEIIVVDNGSTDGTAAEIARRFPHVRVERFEENRGPEALNHAARIARGDLLWRTDDDAYPETPTTLADAVAFMDAYPDVGALTGEILEATIGFQPLNSYPFPRPEGGIPPEGLPANEFCGAAAMIRRDAFVKLGGFWDSFYWEELDLATRMILDGWMIRWVPSVRVFHLSAFSGQRDMNKRWLVQTTQMVRYQWKYFPFFRALGRASVVWLAMTASAIAHRLSVRTYLRGIAGAFRAAIEGRRHEHVFIPPALLPKITMHRSIWDVSFGYYLSRFRLRKDRA
ncbi:MAG: glycosyltransferase family 2 protein [Ignavibacteriae bacterium]|nr:MAG: glycosyltransferase family 2 protein [Ignavibacteriota bacterium]